MAGGLLEIGGAPGQRQLAGSGPSSADGKQASGPRPVLLCVQRHDRHDAASAPTLRGERTL